MSDKVKWAGSGSVASRLAPFADRYVAARVEVNGLTHLGRLMPDGTCVQVCEGAPNPILLPVAEVAVVAVECPECLRIMRDDNLFINTAVRFEALR